MKKLTIIVALTVGSGCATAKRTATQLVIASDGAADELSIGWEAYVDAQIVRCSNELQGTERDTKEGRKECMGLAAKGEALETGLEALVAAQSAVKIAVECDSNPLGTPAEFKAECVDGAKADWAALLGGLKTAWDNLKPYYSAMKEKN
jgi:hypothetical protein